MIFSVTVKHRFPAAALDVAFDVPSRGITALFGPSGAGKSSILGAAAGSWRPDACRITIDNDVFADTAAGIWLPPEHRRAGLVFQDARLFPHLSVAANLRYGLRRAPSTGGLDAIRFDDVVSLLNIGSLLSRRPHALSGGERQRVAIGRALLSQPRVLLMDEPLASLDEALKAEILPYLAALGAVAGRPVLYVTHALDEVTRLADHLVLIEAGQILAAGPLSAVAERADLPLARRDDAAALLEGTVAGHDTARELTRIAAGGACFWVPLVEAAIGAPARLRIPAREVILAGRAPEAISVHNIVPGTVRDIVRDEHRRTVIVTVALGHGTLLARVTPDAVSRLGLAAGVSVLALVKSAAIEVIR